MWCIPPQQDAEFVAHMEDVLAVYKRPYDPDYPVVCMDNLNTHTTASFYKAFSPEEAFRLAQRLEIHHTPKHGSWLDMAECELAAMTTQALIGKRIPDIDALNQVLSAWETRRNGGQKGIDWQFTAEDARIKLNRLYPEVKI